MAFTIYPAIDLRKGKVVRLQYGDPEMQTTFSDDPVATANQWITAGARWLHVVNLDGAFDEFSAANWQALTQLTALGIPVQFGGGIRSFRDAAMALKRGVSRVIFGTIAIEAPDIVADAVQRFGVERIAVGIDARDGRVKTRGWQTDTAVSPIDLGFEMKAIGIQTVIFTDISRDGVLTGVNAAASAELAQETGLNVIASGGVAGLEDVHNTYAYADSGVTGLIIGRALYDKRINLADAIAVSQGNS